MMKKLLLALLLTGTGKLAQCQEISKQIPIEPGVSFTLATWRLDALKDLQYTIDFNIPAQKSDSIRGAESIEFNLQSNGTPLQIDFKQQASFVHSLTVNGKQVAIDLRSEHLVIAAKDLVKGHNKIDIGFIAGDASLNRNDEYVYALFVPDRARTVFPCFDQPGLKSRFLLTLHVPSAWKALANAKLKDSLTQGNQTVYHFAPTDLLPTYLFSFTAGKYNRVTRQVGTRTAEFLYRETDTSKIKISVDSIFDAHQNAVSFLENWTGIPFPFQKIGFVAIPDFQFGGMEHPGEVQYKASSLFLHTVATKDEIIARANLISHETAHMWFGDLVTMQWFNDVWMKEVFANFMADKVTEKVMGSETFNQKFLLDHYPAAYNVDRTPGANPIRQELSNLQEAGTLYGNIIYHKAPIVMRQLELLMGPANFQKGIREYLKKYSYGCATWPELISILGKHSDKDLVKWNAIWVNQTGRPVFNYSVQRNGTSITKLTIDQHPETGPARVWPQLFEITLSYPDHDTAISVQASGEHTTLNFPKGIATPSYVLFNSDGKGYGLFPVDSAIKTQLFSIPNALERAALYINDYENMLAGRYYKPGELVTLFAEGLSKEKNEMNLRLLAGYITNTYWEFLSAADRPAFTTLLEKELWAAMEQQELPNNKKILFKAYQDIYLSADAKSRIYQVWENKKPPENVTLNEDDYTALALTIALKSDTTTQVIARQMERVADPDRKKRLQFLQPALSLDSTERDAFFAGLAQRKNRQKEAWVNAALYYLHHPLRQQTSVKYLPKSLELLEEIQRTGDIFFPQSWLNATFSNYQSAAAWQVVTDFLNSHPGYNPKLKNQILQTTDNLRRAQLLLR